MFFPVSGVEINPLIPPLIALIVASITTSAGVSGAFLLLPFQVSVLNYVNPSVSSTNLVYNIVATPGGLYRYIKEERMAWPLAWVIAAGTLPGVFAGSWIRINYLLDPRSFKLFIGGVLLYLGLKLVADLIGGIINPNFRNNALEERFKERAAAIKMAKGQKNHSWLPPEAVVQVKKCNLSAIEYTFWGETYSFSVPVIFILSLGVGLIGGIYGIGGGAIIAPFCVSVLGLPVYTVAGAALAGTFLTSVAGVLFYSLLAVFSTSEAACLAAPDWTLGMLFGIGGLAGAYCGAYLQKYLKEKLIKMIMAVLVLGLALQYVLQFFI